MRYCINCGSPMGNERFCNQCGTDNGDNIQNSRENVSATVHLPKLSASFVLNVVASILFVIASIILLSTCCKQAEAMSAYSMLFTGNSIFTIVHFVIGMWSCIPALLFILNIKEDNSTSVVGAAIVMIIIMIALCLINVIFANAGGFMKFFSIMAGVYKSKAATIITLEVLAAVLGIIAPRMTK